MSFFQRIREWIHPGKQPILILLFKHGTQEEFQTPRVQSKLEQVKKMIDNHGGTGKSIAIEGLTGSSLDQNAHPLAIAIREYAKSKGMRVIPLEKWKAVNYANLIRNAADKASEKGDYSLEGKRAYVFTKLREQGFKAALKKQQDLDLIVASSVHEQAIREASKPGRTIRIGSFLEIIQSIFQAHQLANASNAFKKRRTAEKIKKKREKTSPHFFLSNLK